MDDDGLRNAEYRRRWPPGDDPLAREAGAQRCAPACGLVRALTHAERLAGPEAARSVIGRYARTTLVWKAQARALIKVRILAGARLACRPDARLTALRAPEQDSGEPLGWCPAAARDAKMRKQQEFAKELRAHKQLVAVE